MKYILNCTICKGLLLDYCKLLAIAYIPPRITNAHWFVQYYVYHNVIEYTQKSRHHTPSSPPVL